MRKLYKNKTSLENIFSELVVIEKKLKGLRELTQLEKAKLEHERALDHLYHSSEIEGTKLTKERIDLAVYGKEESSSK